MFGLGPATKIYIALEGVDMRKGFDGLYGLVRDRLGHEPLSGHLFLFANRERDQTRFCIPSWWICRRVSMASALRKEGPSVQAHRPRRRAGHPR